MRDSADILSEPVMNEHFRGIVIHTDEVPHISARVEKADQVPNRLVRVAVLHLLIVVGLDIS